MSASLHTIRASDPIGIDLKHQMTLPVCEGPKGRVVMYYSKHNDPIYLALNKSGTIKAGSLTEVTKQQAIKAIGGCTSEEP